VPLDRARHEIATASDFPPHHIHRVGTGDDEPPCVVPSPMQAIEVIKSPP
jgi:hypothetical protein